MREGTRRDTWWVAESGGWHVVLLQIDFWCHGSVTVGGAVRVEDIQQVAVTQARQMNEAVSSDS